MVVSTRQVKNSIGGVIEQGRNLASFLDSLRPAEFCRTVPGSTDRVRDITARLVLVQSRMLASLDQPTSERALPLVEVLNGSRLSRHFDAEVAAEMAEHATGPELAVQFVQQTSEIADRLARTDLPAVVTTPTPVQVLDLLRIVGIELVTSSDDVNRAIPGHRPVAFHQGVLAQSVRVLAEALRQLHPGQSIEIRVPPFAAVQCGYAGDPRHTRGTPPTVVETEPLVFLRLCRGRQSFTDGVNHGQIRASGVRADISAWLPLV